MRRVGDVLRPLLAEIDELGGDRSAHVAPDAAGRRKATLTPSTGSCGKAKRYGGQKCRAETGSGFRQIDTGPEADYASLIRPTV